MKKLLAIGLACIWAAAAWAHEGHEHGAPLAVSVAFDQAGSLWRASVRDGHVWIDRSDDLGRHFSPRVRVNPEPQKIGSEGEARPKLAFGPAGQVYVSWTQALAKPYAGHIQFSRSLDRGLSFSAPQRVHRDASEITHRFDALAVADTGRIYVAWIDKRDLVAAQAAKRPYAGAAIYYAYSDDAGASFGPERKLADASCECCRIALQAEPGGGVAALWRQLFDGGVRDHAIARFTDEIGVRPVRASFGGWKIDACPHHGPALARGGDWGWHMAWFDGGERSGLFYARMDGAAWVSSPARRFGSPQRQAGHPALLARAETVYLAWKETGEQDNAIWLARSDDGGRSWGESRLLAKSAGATDYPQLLARGEQAYLVWNAAAEGLRVIELGDPS